MLENISLLIRRRGHQLKTLPALPVILLLSLACIIAAGPGADRVYAAGGNSLYSLSGAEYQLYTDSACTVKAKDAAGRNALLTTDENGNSNVLKMKPGTYYAAEIKPGRGYLLDTGADGKPKVYTLKVTEPGSASAPVSFTSAEPPAYGVPELMVFKTDPSGSFDPADLCGAAFTVKYYAVAAKEEIKGRKPDAQWTFETVKKKAPTGRPAGTYMAGFDWQHDEPVSWSHEGGGKFYEVTEGGVKKRVLPLGWFTIEETRAPAGFVLTHRICYGHIYQPKEGAQAVTEIEGAVKDPALQLMTLTFINEPVPKIGTSASAQKGSHEIKDVVAYEDLIPGQKYILRGWLTDTVTGEKVPGSDGTLSFTAGSEKTGQAEVIMKTDKYEGMPGHSVTAFEELYLIDDAAHKERLVAEHKDLKDSGQTVAFYQDLKISKKVKGNLGDLSAVFTFRVEFKGLEPDKAYKVEGPDAKTFNADHSGNAVIPIRLADGGCAVIRQLPKGAQYRITEEASGHAAQFTLTAENAQGGAVIAQTSGNSGGETDKELATALETVDLFDGTVTAAFENSRDTATLTAVHSDLSIWACAAGIAVMGLLMLIVRSRSSADE